MAPFASRATLHDPRMTAPTRRRRTLSALAVQLVALVVASTATAAVTVGTGVDVTSPVAVGSSVPTSITLVHASSGVEASLNTTLDEIMFVPSCGGLPAGGDCGAAVVDPGALTPSVTGIGVPGTACAGIVFNFTSVDVIQGKYQLFWSGTIVLTPTGSSSRCTIDFLVNVIKMPTKDARLDLTGVQTMQGASVTASASNGTVGASTGAVEVTVSRGTLAITSQASPPTLTLGASFVGTADVGPKPAGSPDPTGTVSFAAYGPDDATCGGAAGPTSTNALVGATTATSNALTPGTAGTYRLVATYDGDVNYAPVSVACSAAPQVAIPAATSPPPASAPPTAEDLPPQLPVSRPVCTTGAPSREWCGDGRQARQARAAAPSDVAMAADGSVVVADTLNHIIRLVRRDGRIFTIAGTGARGMRNGPAGQALFDTPTGVAVWPGRGVLVADMGNEAIRLISPRGLVSTLVSSDGPIRWPIRRPRDVVGLQDGSMLIANTGGHEVIGVSAQGKVSVLAGSGRDGYSGNGRAAVEARLSNPSQVSLADDGSLLIADTGNGAVRRVNRLGTISTVIDDLVGPRGVLGLSGGDVVVGDDSRLILVPPGRRGVVIAGTGRRGFNGDGPAARRQFSAIGQLAAGPGDSILVTERGNDSVGGLPRPKAGASGLFVRTLSAAKRPPSAGGAIDRLRLPPPRNLFGKASDDYGRCLAQDPIRIQFRPAGSYAQPLRPKRGKLAFKADSKVSVAALEVFRYRTHPRPDDTPGKTMRLQQRKGTTRLPGVGRGRYDAVLWGRDRLYQIGCDIRQLGVG